MMKDAQPHSPVRDTSGAPRPKLQGTSPQAESAAANPLATTNAAKPSEIKEAAPKEKSPSEDSSAKSGHQQSRTEQSSSPEIDSLNKEKREQARRLRLLRQCEGVLMVNEDWLEMADYPDDYQVAQARKVRDYWVFSLTVLGCVSLLGFWELVPAWVGGAALGSLFVLSLLGVPAIRRMFFQGKSYSELMAERKMLEFRALSHIRLLEGKEGLAWRCAALSPYNRQLEKRLFASLIQYSRARTIMKHIKTRAHIRLYLLYMLEARKAYEALKRDYFQHHEANLKNAVDA